MILLACLLFLSPAAWGIDPPDSVWVESVGSDEASGASWVILGFTAVEGADGYRVFGQYGLWTEDVRSFRGE